MDFAFAGYLFTLFVYFGVVVLVFDRRDPFLILLISIPFITVAFASLIRAYPFIDARQNLFLTPLIYLLGAFGLEYVFRIESKKIILTLLLVLLGRKALSSLTTYYPWDGQSGVGKIIAHLPELVNSGDPIYLCRNDPVFRYYFERRYPLQNNPLVIGIQEEAQTPRGYLDRVDEMLTQYGRGWLLITTWCGDMDPLLNHVSGEWEVVLFEERFDGSLYYVR